MDFQIGSSVFKKKRLRFNSVQSYLIYLFWKRELTFGDLSCGIAANSSSKSMDDNFEGKRGVVPFWNLNKGTIQDLRWFVFPVIIFKSDKKMTDKGF